MTNPYYTHASAAPVAQSRGSSSVQRAESDSIAAGFDLAYTDIQAIAAAAGVTVSSVETDVATAATVTLGSVASKIVRLTGNTTITSFGTTYNGAVFCRAQGVFTLTNSATLVCPGSANITTQAGDAWIAVPIGNPATGWRVTAYLRVAQSVDAGTSGASFSAYRNAALSLVTTAFTALVCDVEENDLGSNFASGIFTCPAGGDGEYLFTCAAHFQNVAAAQPATVVLYKNGVRHKNGSSVILDAVASMTSTVSAKISLVAGDTVQPYIYQQSGSTIGIGSGNVYTTYFQGMRIRVA